MEDKKENTNVPNGSSLKELSIHIEYIRDRINLNNQERKSDMVEIKGTLKELVEKTPTRSEYLELQKDVASNIALTKLNTDTIDSLRGDRKWAIGALSVLIILQGALVLLAKLYIENIVRETLSAYNIEVK